MRYQIQEHGVGGILDQAISLVKNHFGLLFGITCALFVPLQLIVGFMIISNMPELPANASWFQMFVARAEAAQDPLIQILNFAALLLALPITNAAMVYAVASEYLERPVTVGRSFARAFQVILPFIGTGILMYLAVIGGMFLCVIPGIIFAFWFALWGHVVIIEGVNGVAALKRSKFLMKGNILTLFVLSLLVGTINMGINMFGLFIPQPHVATVVSILASAVIVIFGATAFVVFYFSCRCKVENFDLALLADAVGAEPPESMSEGEMPSESAMDEE